MQKISLQMLRQLVASCLPVVWCQTGKALQVFNTFFFTFSLKTRFLLRIKAARVMKEVELRLEQLRMKLATLEFTVQKCGA